jgi:hypothetical protein
MDHAAGLQRARGHALRPELDPTAESFEWVAPVAPGKRPRTRDLGPAAVDGRVQAEVARSLLQGIEVVIDHLEDQLVSSFRAAVDGLQIANAYLLAQLVAKGVWWAEGSFIQARAQLSGADLAEATRVEERWDRCMERIHLSVSCFTFRGQPVCASRPHIRTSVTAAAAVVSEIETTVALLGTWHQILLALGDPAVRTDAERRRAVDLMAAMRTRPVHFCFLAAVARAEGHEDLWQVGDASSASLLGKAEADNAEQIRATGASRDLGAWNIDRAVELLIPRDRGLVKNMVHLASGPDAVYRMITTAEPEARAGIIQQLDQRGLLELLSAQMPWSAMDRLAWGQRDEKVRARILGLQSGRSGGESLDRLVQGEVHERLRDGDWFEGGLMAAGYVGLDLFSGGFVTGYSEAYDAREEGSISDGEFASQAAMASLRGGLAAASQAVGGAVSARASGYLLGKGVGRFGSRIMAGGAGGTTEAMADVAGGALTGANPDGGDYASAALEGLLGGSIFGPIIDRAAKRSSALGVPEKFHNLLTGHHNRAMSAAFDGRLRGAGADPLRRSEVMQKVIPLSEFRKYYGDVDPATKAPRVDNPHPTVQGYVASAADFGDPSTLTAAQARALNGIDGPWPGYAKYGDPNDPLVSMTFRSRVEPDVPYVPGATPGVRDPQTNHVAGTRTTSGGVREGTLEPGTAIDIVAVDWIGAPPAHVPPRTGAPLHARPRLPVGRSADLYTPIVTHLLGEAAEAGREED